MIRVDGSMGEGGGQLLRYSVALSALTGEPVQVYNIRAKRSNPGLRPQHMTAVRLLARMVDAEVRGMSVGSTTLTFIPKSRVRGGRYELDVGTAGSVSLVLQATLPVAAMAREPVRLRLVGGTAVRWSPPVQYVQYVLRPLLSKFGVRFTLSVLRHGFYPRGGGVVEVLVEPTKALTGASFPELSRVERVDGLSYCANLPSHVAVRQRAAAEEALRARGLRVGEIAVDTRTPALDRGSCIVLWATTDSGVLGSDALGERGKPAEAVGREAASKLIAEVDARAGVDRHALDNLLIYASLAEGRSLLASSELTSHAATVIELCKMIVGARFRWERTERGVRVLCEGVGLTP